MPTTQERSLSSAASAPFDVEAVRADFPALQQSVHDDGYPLVYLDNAATAQKPRSVIDRLSRYYERENSNIHRGVHHLSQQATDCHEEARQTVANFINAPSAQEVVFTRGCTEAINLAADCFGQAFVEEGDEIVVTEMEHHSNLVPWQRLCERTGAIMQVVPVTDDGALIYDEYERMLSDQTALVAVSHVSNTLGTVNPVRRMTQDAHAAGARVLVDGAQAVPHLPVDVQALDADFYCFSGHKMFGPTGIGVLYGKADLLETLPPYQTGGGMIDEVHLEGTSYDDPPHRFEAGTPHIAGAIGLATAIDYMESLGRDAIHDHEDSLLRYATEQLTAIDGLRVIGTTSEKASVLSFMIGDVHPYDAGTILDRLGVAVRTGHHCTQPLVERLGLPGTVRASFALYNTTGDVDRLVGGVRKVKEMFA